MSALPHDTSPSPSYAALFAGQYDEWFAASNTDSTVGFLAALAKEGPPGPLLELGSGTGRIALPLAALGLTIEGIDASPEMTAQLHAKPGGSTLKVTLGNFSAPPEPEDTGRYALVYAAGGTFAELDTQEAQRRCLASAARRLKPGGRLVLDAHLPEALATRGNGTQPVDTPGEGFVLRTRTLHPAHQQYTSDYAVLDDGRMHHVRVSFRYFTPGELDLLAELAGLRLLRRTGGWSGRPLTDSSTHHVSVYELPLDRG
ncbi:class I SAM-dependent DNA methyltransferase [Streptomyces sp. NPDC001741]|uniref:class I SAM-dependent DNA methyltransferase n=1 Tax=Streptomyces sp. NPDC001741 TaxID=3364605 RepID=UPI0036C76965